MENHKQGAALAARRPCLRSAVLLGTALGGVLAVADAARAQTACPSSVDCVNSGPSGGLSLASGPFAVSGGGLEVGDPSHSGASLIDNANVRGAGLLTGDGTIIGNVVNDARGASNASLGTLSVIGNYTQNNDGELNIEITPSGASRLDVSGTAKLSGTLALSFDSKGSYNVGTQYVIVQAQTVTGSGLVYNPAHTTEASDSTLGRYMSAQITTSPTRVTLELTPSASAFSGGHVYAAGLYVQTNALQNALAAPLDPLGDNNTVSNGYWLHGLGGFGRANGSDFNTEGFVVGRGFAVSPRMTIGGAVSNLYTNSSEDESSTRSTSFGAMVYGIYNNKRLNVAGSLGAGHIGNNTDRYIPGLGWHAKSASNGAYEGISVRAQYSLLAPSSPYFLAPYATASYLHSGVGSAQETNAGPLNLRYDGITVNVAKLGGGARLGLSLPVTQGTLTIWGGVGGVGTLGNPRVGVTESLGRFTGSSKGLVAPSAAFVPGVGVQLQGHTVWRVGAGWNGQFGDSTHAQNFMLQLSAHW